MRTRLLRKNKLTYLLCSPLCSPPGTGSHLGGGTVPVPPPNEDPRTPPKLRKLEHVALNSASETGAKNASKCANLEVKFQNFSGAMPQTPIPGTGYGAPPQIPVPSALRRFAPTAPRSGPLAPPSSPNQKSCIHPWSHPPSENPGYAYAGFL